MNKEKLMKKLFGCGFMTGMVIMLAVYATLFLVGWKWYATLISFTTFFVCMCIYKDKIMEALE